MEENIKEIKDSKVRNKIIALLSKTTNNGCTKEEMESALIMANKLMLENFISENDLKSKILEEQLILLKVDLVPIKYDLKELYSRTVFSKNVGTRIASSLILRPYLTNIR